MFVVLGRRILSGKPGVSRDARAWSQSPPCTGGMAMAFVDDFFPPLKARYSFNLFSSAGFIALPFRGGVGVGFGEPHL